MTGFTLALSDTADSALQAVISDGLSSYNGEMGGARDRKPLTIAIKGEDGAPIGGLLGRTSMGLLFIDLFYLPKELRRSGLGSHILKMAEDEARARGCSASVLYTVSFQAPDFYKRHGWTVMGEVAPSSGAARIFLTKVLDQSAAAA